MIYNKVLYLKKFLSVIEESLLKYFDWSWTPFSLVTLSSFSINIKSLNISTILFNLSLFSTLICNSSFIANNSINNPLNLPVKNSIENF